MRNKASYECHEAKEVNLDPLFSLKNFRSQYRFIGSILPSGKVD